MPLVDIRLIRARGARRGGGVMVRFPALGAFVVFAVGAEPLTAATESRGVQAAAAPA